jgi:glutamate racemase
MGISWQSFNQGLNGVVKNVQTDLSRGANPWDRLLPPPYVSGQYIGTAVGQMMFLSISNQWFNSPQGRYKEMTVKGKNGQRYPVKVYESKGGRPLSKLGYQNALTNFINAKGVSAENVFAKAGAHNGNRKQITSGQNPSLGVGKSIAKFIMGDTSKPVLSPDPQNRNDGRWHAVDIRPGETIQVRFKGWDQGKPVFSAKGTGSAALTLNGFSSFSEAASFAAEKARGGALTPRVHDNLKLSAGESSANKRAFSRNSDVVLQPGEIAGQARANEKAVLTDSQLARHLDGRMAKLTGGQFDSLDSWLRSRNAVGGGFNSSTGVDFQRAQDLLPAIENEMNVLRKRGKLSGRPNYEYLARLSERSKAATNNAPTNATTEQVFDTLKAARRPDGLPAYLSINLRDTTLNPSGKEGWVFDQQMDNLQAMVDAGVMKPTDKLGKSPAQWVSQAQQGAGVVDPYDLTQRRQGQRDNVMGQLNISNDAVGAAALFALTNGEGKMPEIVSPEFREQYRELAQKKQRSDGFALAITLAEILLMGTGLARGMSRKPALVKALQRPVVPGGNSQYGARTEVAPGGSIEVPMARAPGTFGQPNAAQKSATNTGSNTRPAVTASQNGSISNQALTDGNVIDVKSVEVPGSREMTPGGGRRALPRIKSTEFVPSKTNLPKVRQAVIRDDLPPTTKPPPKQPPRTSGGGAPPSNPMPPNVLGPRRGNAVQPLVVHPARIKLNTLLEPALKAAGLGAPSPARTDALNRVEREIEKVGGAEKLTSEKQRMDLINRAIKGQATAEPAVKIQPTQTSDPIKPIDTKPQSSGQNPWRLSIGNDGNLPLTKPATTTDGTPKGDGSSISPTPNKTVDPGATASKFEEPVDAVNEVIQTVDLFTKPGLGWTPDMQYKLSPIMAAYMKQFDGRENYSIGLPDSSAGGRVAYPYFEAAFFDATGMLPSTIIIGDDHRAPYGELSSEDLGLHTNNMFSVIQGFGLKCIVGACNTMHFPIDNDLPALQGEGLPPYVHLIRTTALAMYEEAAKGDTKQVLLATPFTVKSKIYERHINTVSGGKLKVEAIAAGDFAKAVNRGDHLKPENSQEWKDLKAAADKYVELIPADATSVWLCCTHYPALTSMIQRALDDAGKGHIKIVNPMQHQGYKAAEEYWKWVLSGGATKPGDSFDTFMISSEMKERLEVERIGNGFATQGDNTKPKIPFIWTGPFDKVTHDTLQRAVDTLPGKKPQIDRSKTLPGELNDTNNRLTPPANTANTPSTKVAGQKPANEVPPRRSLSQGDWNGENNTYTEPQSGPTGLNAGDTKVPPQHGNEASSPVVPQGAPANPPWNLPALTEANQKSIADSYAKYQQAGGTKTPQQFFIGTPQDPGVMEIFDEHEYLATGRTPSITAIAETLAVNHLQIAKEGTLLNDAYEAYSATAQFHPYTDGADVLNAKQFVTELSQEYVPAGALAGTGKTLGEFAVEKFPPLATSAFYQDPLKMAERFPHLGQDERDRITSLAQKAELLQKYIIPYYKANPIIENGRQLVWYNKVTNRLEIDTNFLVFDPRANGVFPVGQTPALDLNPLIGRKGKEDSKKPALDLNALVGRTDRYDLPSKQWQLVIPTTRPASVDPKTNDQYIRPGFEHTNNKWVLSARETAYLPKVFAGDPRLQSIELQKDVARTNKALTKEEVRTEIARLDEQAAPIKAELTETYLAKRRNWAAFVIHALEKLRLPRTEVAAMLADQQIASPPPPIGGPRGINVPQLSGSGVQPERDPVTGLQTVTYVDLRNITSKQLAEGDFSSADVETRGPGFGQAVVVANHRRGEVAKNIALAALLISSFNAINTTFIQPALKKPEPPPTPPIEKLTASVLAANQAMQGFALQSAVPPTNLDRVTLPKIGLTLFLAPVGNLPNGAVRPTFVQLVETAIQTNNQILRDAGVDTAELLKAAQQLDAAKVPTGKGTTIPPKPTQ